MVFANSFKYQVSQYLVQDVAPVLDTTEHNDNIVWADKPPLAYDSRSQAARVILDLILEKCEMKHFQYYKNCMYNSFQCPINAGLSVETNILIYYVF